MADFKKATFEEVVDHVSRERKVTILLGAGASASGGIPLAAGMVDLALEKYPYLRQSSDQRPTYAQCMSQLTSGGRQDLVRAACADAKINWAHVALAQLVKSGYVDRILTTNFDPLIVRACALVGEFPAVYDLAVTEKFSSSLVAEQAVFHLHGQHAGMVQVHTADQFELVKERLGAAIDAAGQHQTWIVVGYSGDNDPLIKVLATRQFVRGLYWLTYRDEQPVASVCDELLCKSSDCRVVTGYDADDFLVKLAISKDVFPPDFVSTPFSSMKILLDGIAPFSSTMASTDFTSDARRRVESAIQEYEKGELGLGSPKNQEENQSASDLLRNWANLMGGRRAKVLGEFANASGRLKIALAPIAAIAEAQVGDKLAEEATTKSGAEADRLFAEAEHKYADAIMIKPDMHEALNNWGVALTKHAQTKSGPEADRLFADAGHKYAEALKIKPDKHEALHNWGNALSDHARTKSGANADRLFAEAGQKYADAIKIKPDLHDTLNNWGNALSDHAKTKSGAEADRLFAEAGQKYADAIKIKPDAHDTLNNWGSALSDHAQTKSGAEADRLFAEAGQKYADAIKIKPDAHGTLNNWGSALSDHAQTKSGAEADRLFAEADDKLRRGDELVPGCAAYNRGCIAALRNDKQLARQFLKQSLDAGELPTLAHLDADTDLDSIRNEAWFEEIRTGAR